MASQKAPSRAALEGLSTSALQSLIVDAAAVLAARADAVANSDSAKLPAFKPPSRGSEGSPQSYATPQSFQGDLFTFGIEAPTVSRGASSGSSLFLSGGSGLFASTGGGLFGGSAPAGSPGSLFGGTGAGLFSAASSSSSSSLFGASATGGLFGSSSSSLFADSSLAPRITALAAAGDEDGEDGPWTVQDGEYVKEEEITEVAGWAPSVTLEVQDSIETGDEGEEQVYSQRSKLLRFRDGEWKERGVGEARLLRNRKGLVRFLLRQEKTGKVVANHLLVDRDPYCDLRPHFNNEKVWVWSAQDCADDALEVEQFALKFGSVELAAAFKEAFDAAKEDNGKASEVVSTDLRS